MHKSLRFCFAILFVCTTLLLSAQEPGYQRAYFSEERTIINVASETLSDGGFYLANVSVSEQGEFFVNVSKHNPKGNLTWAEEYEFPTFGYPTTTRTISTELLPDNTLFLTVATLEPQFGVLSDSKIMFKVNGDTGDIIWSNVVSDPISIPQNIITFPAVTTDVDGNMNVFTTQSRDTSVIHLNSFDLNNNNTFSQSYFPTDTLGNLQLAALVDAKHNNIDSSNAVLFVPDIASQTSGLFKLDKNGDPVFAKRYTINPDSLPAFAFQLYSMDNTSDSAYVATGFYFNQLDNTISNLVVKIDDKGDIIWSRQVEANQFAFVSQVNDIINTPMNEILVTGKYISLLAGTQGDFAVYFDQDGNVLRQYDYASENSIFILQIDPTTVLQFTWGELNTTPDGATLYTTTGINSEMDNFGSYVIKMDSIGQAFCQDTINFPLVSDYDDLVVDTLLIDTTNIAVLDTITSESLDFNDYDIPVLMVLDTSFCPQDPIDATIEAFLPEAVAYIWSTGDTTSSIRVFEEGMYMVTVTMGEDVCYTLCDTSNIVQLDFPEAVINVNNSRVCEEDILVLNSSLTMGAGARDFIWSTGETSSSIEIMQPGSYSVTITDNCDNSASADINISPDQFLLGMTIDINEDLSLLCDEDIVILTASSDPPATDFMWSTGETTSSIQVAIGDTYQVTITNICNETETGEFTVQPSVFVPMVNVSLSSQNQGECENTQVVIFADSDAQITQYDWSNGGTDSNIVINEAGTYSVTVTDICGDTGESIIEIQPDRFEIPELSISVTQGQFNCEEGGVLLDFINNNGNPISDINWSNGATTDTTRVLSAGTYTVTVTDNCGQTSSAETTLEAGDIEALRWPNIFFPNSNLDINRTFGPYLECPEAFTGADYKLEIYNRWGDRLFESDRVDLRWNGRPNNSGNQVQEDVYMYIFSYLDGNQIEIKGGGSVTLSR